MDTRLASSLHLALTIDGRLLAGDSTVRGREGLIELRRCRWSAAAGRSTAALTTAAGMEVPLAALRLGYLHLDKAWDRSSAALLQALSRGERAESAVLTLSGPPPADTDAAAPTLLSIELTDVALLDVCVCTDADAAEHQLREHLVLGGARSARLRHFPGGQSGQASTTLCNGQGAA
ncbi:type VI secretion system tube protein Hcp [Roseateles sp. YR242]|uniref:type VI secretion system tube protein Hcp n=1 Tax=Roseateles sp. YR242 TaxID=1855305 RepID=UPI001C42FF5A|nr:type VI secretion system tube protein Hcp [Roseateles sp. YR242]